MHFPSISSLCSHLQSVCRIVSPKKLETMKVVGRVASALILTSCFRIVQTLSYLPLSTSGRWMLDNAGRRVTYAGTNWPGHLEAMIPEGLQYQSIPSIVSKIKSLGMNSVRLTYATEMVDDIYQRGSDMTMQASLVNALGQRNGIAIFNKIVANHPGLFTAATTRLQVSRGLEHYPAVTAARSHVQGF